MPLWPRRSISHHVSTVKLIATQDIAPLDEVMVGLLGARAGYLARFR